MNSVKIQNYKPFIENQNTLIALFWLVLLGVVYRVQLQYQLLLVTHVGHTSPMPYISPGS